MCETLIAILLVTSSAKGSSLVYQWPPSPESSIRLARPRPKPDITCIHGDNPWRAANAPENPAEDSKACPDYSVGGEDESYLWRRRPSALRRRSVSHSRSHPASRRASPSQDSTSDPGTPDGNAACPMDIEYDSVLGYSSEFLAGSLCPPTSMCHQKFGLVVDDLAFVGHPVCADSDDAWRFKEDKVKVAPRGRGSRKGETPQPMEKSLTPERPNHGNRTSPDSSWLRTFHFVLVLDRPDPSSSSSGVVWKYFDAIYEHIAFAVTAVLYQEQVLRNFVETECDILGTLKDEFRRKGDPYSDYMQEALKVSSLAPAMKALYEAVKEESVARITLNDLPFELQLPSYLDSLLHPGDEYDAVSAEQEGESGFINVRGDADFSSKLPQFLPWKGLLLLNDDDDRRYEQYMSTPYLPAEDGEQAEQLFKFLDLASISLSLADMASLLDWNLETEVYPIVRWLVHHKRAKLVDVVHPGLKTIFAVPQKLSAPLCDLASEFDRAFPNVNVPPLPQILSMVSMATHQQSANHFYATVVRSKDLVPLYQDVVVWMLKRDLLTTLHLRIRIVATEELKDRVRMKFEMARAKRERLRARDRSRDFKEELTSSENTVLGDETKGALTFEPTSESSLGVNWLSFSPKSARKQARQFTNDKSQPNDAPSDGATEKYRDEVYDDDVGSSGEEFGREDWYRSEDNNPYSSMISDPARATRLERLWLAAMSEYKDRDIARRFEKINQFFDGKCTDDEILFRADISRKQLREVLHHYEEYLQTFLHSS